MKNTRQINYWTIGGFEGEKPVAQAMTEAKEMGYQGIELTFGAGHFASGISEQECKEIRKTARGLELKIETLASGVYWGQQLSSPDSAVRKAAVTFTKEYLQVAKWVGAKTVLVIPGAVSVPWDPAQPTVPYQDVWKNATASIRQCLPTAKKLGINLALENVWGWFLTDPMAMKMFVDQFKSSRVGVYFDIGNCLINGYPEHWISILGKRIKAVHYKNFSRDDCGGVIHGFGDDLLKGDVDFAAVSAALKASKYKGAITAEMIPFCRLPDLILPDMLLAKDTASKLAQVCKA